MKCPSCGHENRENARFCDECGGSFGQSCPSCGTELRLKAKFCDECGKPTRAAAEAVIERDPVSYTPKHLAEKILTSRSALEGERKTITALFADITAASTDI